MCRIPPAPSSAPPQSRGESGKPDEREIPAEGMNLEEKVRSRIAAIRVRTEETPAPRLGYTAGIRAGLVRQNAASSPASSEKFLHFCGVKPESSIGPPIGQA